jgi:hypothetical protein
MAKKKGPPAQGETKVELHLPPKLYDRAKALYDEDVELFSEVVSAVFSRSELFGINQVSLVKGVTKSKRGKAGKQPKKTCDADPTP